MRTEVILVFFISLAFNYQAASGGNWGYSGKKGPANWEATCATGQSQSPVNLEKQFFDKSLVLDPFNFDNYGTKLVGAKLNNNGHTVQLDSPSSFTAQISGGGLNSTYQFAQLHFHWGDSKDQGSEHTMNGQAYPLEVHLVHFNKKYGSLGKAAAKPDGLAVLGIFYEIQRGDNNQWSELTAKLAQVKKPKGKATTISSLSLENFLPRGTASSDFYRYSGSLTTPGCFESVTWTVFRQALKISEGQMSFFRSLAFNNGKPMVNNFRPVQPHNSRKISASFMDTVGPDWGYSGKKGAEYWGALCATGKSQSPVNLKKQVFDKSSVNDPFVFDNYQTNLRGAKLENNGHTVQLNSPENVTAQISGGGLGATYQFAQLHFHWGNTKDVGSEHTLDGQAYPLELHLVHFNTKYGSLQRAANKPDGLAVLGIFFEIQQGDNKQWSDLTAKLTEVKNSKEKTIISSLSLKDFLPTGAASQHFYRYAGSLTTPPCFESVTWTVFHEPLSISEAQMSFFRSLSLKDGNPMVNNFRPVQPLFGRKISASYSEVSSSWGYSGKKGPEYWEALCATGKSQSPIDLEKQVFEQNSVSEPFNFANYQTQLRDAKLKNNGHTVQLDSPNNFTAQISGGGLGGTYQFAQLHFHWGDSNNKGSEHTMDGQAFPLEVHLVHFNTKYGSLGKAAAQPDGLAVLGIFFEIQQSDNNEFSDLTAKLAQVTKPKGDAVTISSLSLNNFLPGGAASQHFYRYAGSLTTPPCFESVTWTVFHEPLAISKGQMSFFRSLLIGNGKPMVNNFRPVQKLNGRKISASYTDEILEGPRSLPTIYENDSNKNYGKKWKENSKKPPTNVDHFFLLIMSIIIFFMQCGFAFMEAGAVRSKNTVNILIKNWLDMCIGALVYWSVGFALTFGPDAGRFMGSDYFFFNNMPADKLSKWFFQFVFAATAATLVSGSLAERCNFVAYLVYSVMITGFIYPIIAHWAWHPEGWLYIWGYHDFAGSGVVHLTGAVCALVGCILMGPRIGRFDKNGMPCHMPGHSVPLSALGGLILVFGFFACNGTKQGSISNDGDGIAVATAIVNTALGTSAAGVSTLLFNKLGWIPGTGGNYSFLITMNGSLTGTVALCAGCNVYEAWAAVVVGAICGPLFLCCNWLLIHCQIDDPLDAIPVHGAGGIWGTLAVHLFKWEGVFLSGSSEAAWGFLFNIIGLLAIITWTGTLSFLMFYGLKKIKMLRVEAAAEFKGMDMLKHGESAYPADAWVEQQYMKEDALSGGDELSDNGATGNGSSNGATKKGGKSKDGLPPNMRFSRAASYNNPHEMFPSASKLFAGMNAAAGGVTKSSGKTSRASSMSVVNEAEDGTPAEKEKLNVIQELNVAGGIANIAVAMVTASDVEKDENTLI